MLLIQGNGRICSQILEPVQHSWIPPCRDDSSSTQVPRNLYRKLSRDSGRA
jgi:hypothetical protein